MVSKGLTWALRRARYVIECLEDRDDEDGEEDAKAIEFLIIVARKAEKEGLI